MLNVYVGLLCLINDKTDFYSMLNPHNTFKSLVKTKLLLIPEKSKNKGKFKNIGFAKSPFNHQFDSSNHVAFKHTC